MSTLYSIGLMNQLGDALESAGFSPNEVTKLRQYRNLADFRLVLNDQAKVIPHGFIMSVLRPAPAPEPKVITIDRDKPFDTAFVGVGWATVVSKTDVHSISLTEVDLTRIHFETTLKWGEERVKGDEKLKRLIKRKDLIRLDAKVFQTVWENSHLIPESWKAKMNGKTNYIYFDGTVLRNPTGDWCVLCLYWGGGDWHWDVIYLGRDSNVCHPSAVLYK